MAALVFDNQQVREMVLPISNKFLTTSAARYSKATSLKKEAILSLGRIRHNIKKATSKVHNDEYADKEFQIVEQNTDLAMAIIKSM